MTEQLPIAEIPNGFFEYHATFKEPIFAAWFHERATGELTTGMYKILTPWGIDLSKATFSQSPKNLQEVQMSFSTGNPPVLISLGLGGVDFIAQNANWSHVHVLVPMFQTVLDHLKSTVPTEIGFQQTILGFHVKPGPRPFREVMQQFVNSTALGNEEASMYGVGTYGPTYSLLMDNSLAITGGLFVKITRVFPVETGFEEMASILWKDQEGILGRLGFRTQ
jgi:hypothetical protein